jgi:hypothetical protein
VRCVRHREHKDPRLPRFEGYPATRRTAIELAEPYRLKSSPALSAPKPRPSVYNALCRDRPLLPAQGRASAPRTLYTDSESSRTFCERRINSPFPELRERPPRNIRPAAAVALRQLRANRSHRVAPRHDSARLLLQTGSEPGRHQPRPARCPDPRRRDASRTTDSRQAPRSEARSDLINDRQATPTSFG